MVKHKPPGGPRAAHWCRWRWWSRRLFRSYLEGWHSGYRFAVENADDPMVSVDGDDYGRGWAGYMRTGDPVRLIVGDEDGQ
jgi:hypothetical protein